MNNLHWNCACRVSLTKLYNLAFDSIQKANIDNKTELQVTPLHLRGMDVTSLNLFDKTVDHSYDVDQMLSFIQEAKCNLSKERKRASEQYIMLNIIERIIDNFDLWDERSKNSELTFYRRFAKVLDCLFINTSIKLADGELGSRCTETAIEINKAIFHTTENSSPSYSRKVALLLKLNKTTSVELSSSVELFMDEP